jgi:hypothetical protein
MNKRNSPITVIENRFNKEVKTYMNWMFTTMNKALAMLLYYVPIIASPKLHKQQKIISRKCI